MIVFILMLLAISLYGISFVQHNEKYMGIHETTSVKGIFISLVFFSHICSYLDKMMIEDVTYSIFRLVFSLIGQLMVVMFFFYSGFGVMESMKKENYLKRFPRNRIIITIAHFQCALLLFLLLNLILGIHYPMKTYVLSVIAWDSIGNSNWYIFDIIILYCISYFCLRVLSSENRAVIAIVLSVLFLIIILRLAGKSTSWYNTIICYPLGMLFCRYRANFENIVQGKKYYWIVSALFMVFLLCRLNKNFTTHMLIHPLFASLIVMLTMKIHIGNKVLFWLGHNLFPIYILQRLPMIALYKLQCINNGVIYVLVCICITMGLTIIFNKVIKMIDQYLKIS